jgi:glycosyltransferase involved in cell wall biosynthesis
MTDNGSPHIPEPQTVAVLIPFFHKENLAFLQESVDSIHKQETRHTVQIYLGIDGAMNPEIEQFLTLNSPKLYKIIHNQVNQGLAVMLNRMIDKLEDEPLILRLDADDIALPYRVETQVNLMLNNPEIHVSGGSIIGSSEFSGD